MARRKIGPSTTEAAADLPELTAQQSRFVESLLKGMTATDAYRSAYDTENMRDKSVWGEASKLKSHPGIARWLAQARKNGLATATVTLDGHLQELERLKAIAIETGNVGAAVQAEQLRGKAAGHYVEKHQDVGNQFDPQATLREVARDVGPDVAAAWAKEHGIEWQPDDHATKH